MLALSPIHFLSLALTLALIIGVIGWSARSVSSAEGFSLAGRSSGAVLIAGGIVATCIGGSATVGTAQFAFSVGLSGWWFTLGMGVGLLLMAFFYARPLRRSQLETLPQFLALHYGPAAGPLTSIISSLGTLFSIVASSLSALALMHALFGLQAWEGAAAVIVLSAACVFFGGLKSAEVAGALKIVLIWGSVCVGGVVAALALARLPNFSATFPAFPWFSLAGRGMGDALGNLASLIAGMLCTQPYIQAIYSATDARVARLGAVLAAAVTIPVGLPSVAIGMFMHAAHPEITPILALPLYVVLYLPPWLGGVALAAILFSVIGSIAGLALGIGTMVSRDIGMGMLGLWRDRTVLRTNRLAVLAATALGAGIALANPDSYVLDWNYLSMALRAGGVVLPMSLAIFWPGHLSGRWALGAMAGSTAMALAGRFLLGLTVSPMFVAFGLSIVLAGGGLLAGALAASRHKGAGAAPRVPPKALH